MNLELRDWYALYGGRQLCMKYKSMSKRLTMVENEGKR
jgi:hypothetical protein